MTEYEIGTRSQRKDGSSITKISSDNTKAIDMEGLYGYSAVNMPLQWLRKVTVKETSTDSNADAIFRLLVMEEDVACRETI